MRGQNGFRMLTSMFRVRSWTFEARQRRLFHRRALTHVLEEVVAFVVHQDEGGEVFDGDFPHGFHAHFWEGDDFLRLDVILRKQGSRAAR